MDYGLPSAPTRARPRGGSVHSGRVCPAVHLSLNDTISRSRTPLFRTSRIFTHCFTSGAYHISVTMFPVFLFRQVILSVRNVPAGTVTVSSASTVHVLLRSV